MSVRYLFCIASLTLVVLAPAAVAEDLLVLKDGSSLEVETMTVRGGRVEVRLPDSNQFVAYSVSDVDLEASGLAPTPPATAYTSNQKPVRGGFDAAIAPPTDNQDGVTITDQDVEHVRQPQEDEDEGETAPPARVTSLLVSNLQRQVSPNGVLTVTGRVTNSGNVPVSAISITGDAEDGDGASLGRGTTGISSALDAGEVAEFSIAIPVSGAVANVKVSAIAAVSEFTFEQVAAPQGDSEEEDEGFEEAVVEESEEDFEEDFEDEFDSDFDDES